MKLFLVIGTLVAVVTAALSLAAYREMRASALASASARLDGIAIQWARLFESSTGRTSATLRMMRDDVTVRTALLHPSAQANAAAAGFLKAQLQAGQISVIELLDANRVTVAQAGNAALVPDAGTRERAIAHAERIDSGAITPLRAAGATAVLGTSVVRIRGADGAVLGYVMQTTQLHVNPSPETLNRLFGGEATNMRLANRDGSLWTDLAKPIPGPPIDSLQPGRLITYTSAGSGKRVITVLRPIAGAPYLIALETGEEEVVAPAHEFLLRVLAEDAAIIVVGLLVALWLSNSFMKPIAQLTTAVESVAAGDYTNHLVLAPRGDEFGHLGRAFAAMVTQLESAFASQHRAEENHRILFESAPLPLWVYDLETLRILAVNEVASRHYGYSRDELLAMRITDLRPESEFTRLAAAVGEARTGARGSGEWTHRKKDGTLIQVEVHAHSLEFQGRPSRIVLIHDITERRRATELIRRQDEQYRRLVEASHDGITLTAPDGRFLAVNPAFTNMLGYETNDEVLALGAHGVFPGPGDRDALVAKLLESGQLHRHEIQLKRKDGSLITAQYTARFVTDPDSGEEYLESVIEDVTELRRVERQFLQAQKMDAVGQLAGGVAHDFNNLLTVILSYSDFLLLQLAPDAPQRRDIEAIRDAGASAAALTRQLLVFSRQQVIEPTVMRLNDLVLSTATMLTRLLGEHVELSTVLDPEAGAVRVDAGQIEQVIVNLAVNARDAMPNGGRLLIESRNVEFPETTADRGGVYPRGPHVMLAVSDNGTGMDAEIQARLFEPFFTTKEAGKGTGLGLATVYGIVKQSGGQIFVYSEPGRGTSFKIYFPRFAEASDVPREALSAIALSDGTETILVVEDEPVVRKIVRQVLERGGYHVLEASDGEAALDAALNHSGPIDLLLTDVVMPRMSGRELADRFARVRPLAAVLFVSGYTDDAIVHHGVLEREMHFLQKPFTPDTLKRKVRSVLDAGPRATRPS